MFFYVLVLIFYILNVNDELENLNIVLDRLFYDDESVWKVGEIIFKIVLKV